jgi:hypothetical protein
VSGAWKFLILCIVAAAAAAIMTVILHVIQVVPAGALDVKYTDFLSITLTALGLMITVLGIFVAAAGVIGWTTLESKLRDHSLEYFAKQLEKEGPLRKELEELFAEIAYSGIEGLKAPPEAPKKRPRRERPFTD